MWEVWRAQSRDRDPTIPRQVHGPDTGVNADEGFYESQAGRVCPPVRAVELLDHQSRISRYTQPGLA